MYEPRGTHCLLELTGCPPGRLADPEAVARAIREAATAAGATLVDLRCHQFDRGGVTAVALLSESHLSVHTWPEHGYAAADIFTCGDRTDPQAACRRLAASLAAGEHHMRTLPRGVPADLAAATSGESD